MMLTKLKECYLGKQVKLVKAEKIQTALDLIRDKYGVDIIKPASFIEHDKENV